MTIKLIDAIRKNKRLGAKVDKQMRGIEFCRIKGNTIYVSEYAFAILAGDELMSASLTMTMEVGDYDGR